MIQSVYKGGLYINFSNFFEIIELIIAIIGLFFGYLSLKPSLDSYKNENNTININLKVSNNDSDEVNQRNNYTKLRLIYLFILLGMIIVFCISIYLNIGKIIIVETTKFSPLNKIINYLYFGLGVTSKLFAILIPIFTLTLLTKILIIKNSYNRKFNIFIYSILLITSTIFTFKLNNIDYLYYGTNYGTSDYNLALANTLLHFSPLILAYQLVFITYVLHQILSNIIIDELPSPLLSITIKKFCHKIFMPLCIVILLLYWNYILR